MPSRKKSETMINNAHPQNIEMHSLQRRERWLGSAGWRGEEEEGGRRNVSSETRGRRLPETTKRPTRGRRLPEKMKKSVVLSRNKNVPLADCLREKKAVSLKSQKGYLKFFKFFLDF